MIQVKFIPKSSNSKTGKLSQTYSDCSTCPTRCPFKGHGCYAQNFPCSKHWKECNTPINELKNLVQGNSKVTEIIRHNVAGDIATSGTSNINWVLVDMLIDAYKGHKVYTYTHCTVNDENIEIVKDALENGFVINFSCEKFIQAEKAYNNGCPAVLTVWKMDSDELEHNGIKYKKCPANHGDVTCLNCPNKCWEGKRDFVIVFEAHGAKKTTALKELADKGILMTL